MSNSPLSRIDLSGQISRPAAGSASCRSSGSLSRGAVSSPSPGLLSSWVRRGRRSPRPCEGSSVGLPRASRPAPPRAFGPPDSRSATSEAAQRPRPCSARRTPSRPDAPRLRAGPTVSASSGVTRRAAPSPSCGRCVAERKDGEGMRTTFQPDRTTLGSSGRTYC